MYPHGVRRPRPARQRLAAPVRAAVILLSGTLEGFASTEPAYAGGIGSGPLSVRIDFTPTGADRYGVRGPMTWTIAAGGATLTPDLPAGDVVWWPTVSGPFDFGEDIGGDHIYAFRSLLMSAGHPDIHSKILVSVRLAPSFVRVTPPPGQNDSDHYLDYLASDLALGGPLPGSTLDFSREDGDGVHYTSFGATITGAVLVTPEPATLLTALIGAAAVVLWARREGRR